MPETTASPAPLQRTPLWELHRELGARMVPFAGYDMPVQYPLGILREHEHTRRAAGLFDVSHMGQAVLAAADKRHETVASALEALVPADMAGLKPGQQRYTQLLNDAGGIIDDLMVTRSASAGDDGSLMLVVNASRKAVDYAHIVARLPAGAKLTPVPERALLALQGPGAAVVLASVCPQAVSLGFMQAAALPFTAEAVRRMGVPVFDNAHVSRSGYTGEDGFEISVRAAGAVALARLLLAHPQVQPIGLGARDSLRLEAGLCLYGHDLDETTSPVESGLVWSLQKRRREEGGFPGAARIQAELRDGPRRLRVGIRPQGRQTAREGTDIMAAGRKVGTLTSGGFGPSINAPVAMGYVEAGLAKPGTALSLVVRGKEQPAQVVALPFVPHRYHRKSST
jgi:aminomethyltransferase